MRVGLDRDPLKLREQQFAYAAGDPKAYFDAAQNARIVGATNRYHGIMYRGSVVSWNVRDRHMFETLQNLVDRGEKAMLWAHNLHIGNAAATAMGQEGEFNICELAKTAYSDEAVLIGFGPDRGTVATADDWDESMRVMQVRSAQPDSYTALFRAAGHSRGLTDIRGLAAQELREVLTQPRLERAIGVVYRPDTEFLSHYFEAVPLEQFDAFVWFEETTAVTTPTVEEPHRGASETFPMGL